MTHPSTPAISPESTVDSTIDITKHLCPMTFVHTRLALDRMRPGQTLAVILRGPEPRINVPRSAKELGHQVLSLTERQDGTTRLIIRKA